MNETPSITPGDLEDCPQTCLVLEGVIPPILGIQPAAVDTGRVALRVSRPPTVSHEASGLVWDTAAYWVAEFWHPDQPSSALDKASGACFLLDEALAALNVTIGWISARDQATGPKRVVPWLRRFGRIDVRGAVLWESSGSIAVFTNPVKSLPLDPNAHTPGMAQVIVTIGPLAQPLPYFTRRFSGVFDLLNHGFVVEAVLTAFTTFEAWLRQAITYASGDSVDKDADERISKRVRDATLRSCLTTLPVSLGWTQLDELRSELLADVLEVARARNKIVHEGFGIARSDAEWSVGVLTQALEWLRRQLPDTMPPLPSPTIAVPRFYQWRPGDKPMSMEPLQQPHVELVIDVKEKAENRDASPAGS